jgi:glycosyltransferase involved in cell wall biosynthesis
MPLVTVVVPNFNYGHFIEEALESVVAQTHADWEVIVVDDNSTDDSRERVKEVIRRHRGRPIRLIHHDAGPSGTPTPINIGIRHMKGEYFAWLSSDDAFEPSKLARQVEVLEADPSIAMAYTSYTRVEDEGRAVGSFRALSRCDDGILATLIDGNVVNGNTVLVRRAVLEELGPFLERDQKVPELWLAAEYFYWLRIAARHPIVGIDEPLHRSRIHAGNHSQNNGTVFPALERIFIRRLFDEEEVRVTPMIVRAVASRGLTSLAARLLERLHGGDRARAVDLLERLERSQDSWDLGRYAEARDLDRDRIRAAFRPNAGDGMLRAVLGLDRVDLEPYRTAAAVRLAAGRGHAGAALPAG